MSEIEAFRNRVEEFIAEREWSPTRFGRMAASDPLFVFQLRAGREPRTATRSKVEAFMAAENAKQAAA